MFVVEVPPSFPNERLYILEFILGEILGLKFEVAVISGSSVKIYRQMDSEAILEIEDCFFKNSESNWLQPPTMPRRPLSWADLSEWGLRHQTLPVLFGNAKDPIQKEGRKIRLQIDIFGSAFFLMTQYENFVSSARDEHGRALASASIAYQEGFLLRPIVNEYAEILWKILKSLWPDLLRRERQLKVHLQHDIDNPFFFALSWKRFKQMRREILSLAAFFVHLRDPYNSYDWLMDQSESISQRSTFFFLSGGKTKFDPGYKIKSSKIQSVFKKIRERGHEIGFHPSYESLSDPKLWFEELQSLREASPLPITQSRQHFLRLKIPTLWNLCDESGIAFDSTLAYPDQVGFRAGTCFEFPLYDLVTRKKMKVRERPLIASDFSLISSRYMNLGASKKVRQILQDLRSECEFYGGDFTVLWHNSSLRTRNERDLYLGGVFPLAA